MIAASPGTDSRRIVDAHVHVIEHIAGTGRRGESRAIGDGRVRWLDGEVSRLIPSGWGDASFTHDRLVRVMDEHGVDAAVLMQGSFYGFCNDYTHEAQQRYPGRLFGMGTLDPYAFQGRLVLERLVDVFGFRGLKFETSRAFGLMGFHPDFLLDGSFMEPILVFAEERALVLSLDLGTFDEPSLQLDAMARIARRHPGIRFVVEHLFYPGPARFDDVRAGLETLAPCANICFTLASIPNSTPGEPFPYASACRYAAIARDTVGASRILWGSDLPSVAVKESYRHLIEWVGASGVFTDAELDAVYAGNARRTYRLPAAAPAA